VKSGNRQDSGKYVLGSWGGERSGSPAVHSACPNQEKMGFAVTAITLLVGTLAIGAC